MKLNEKELKDFWENLNRIDNINKITKEFNSFNDREKYMSWYDFQNCFSKISISLLDDTLQKLLNKEVVEIKEYVLRIVIKYLVFKFDKNIVEDVFGFILLNYDINFITEEIESLVYDENEIEYEYPEDPTYKHPLFYLELLFEKDRKDKEFRKELIRQNNEVCIPSFNKYFNQFKSEYGYTYISPNKINDSSNYGSFLDSIKNI